MRGGRARRRGASGGKSRKRRGGGGGRQECKWRVQGGRASERVCVHSPRGGLGRSSYGKALRSAAAVSHLLICKTTRTENQRNISEHHFLSALHFYFIFVISKLDIFVPVGRQNTHLNLKTLRASLTEMSGSIMKLRKKKCLVVQNDTKKAYKRQLYEGYKNKKRH